MKALRILLVSCAAAWLVPTATAQSSNTIVRFHFYRGSTVIGDVDVELFDQDKPVTVSNFLRYVRSGAYHNLVLNRCVPGFVIQAGALWSLNPKGSSIFYTYPNLQLTPTFPEITNEFSVGPVLNNVFGTIAMARVSGETNSASSEFFFNLGNNSTNSPNANLDEVDGGFTVFGRVVGNSSALDYFNHPSSTLNIFNLGPPYYSALPLGTASRLCTTLANCPRSLDLYHIRISILPNLDTNPPTVNVIYPPANGIVTNSPILVRGTATDDQGVSSILYQIGSLNSPDRIPFSNAPAGADWSFPVEIPAGTNYMHLSSVDGAGRRSEPVERRFFYSVRMPLNLTNDGMGTILGPTNQQLLEIGKFYTVTARPAAGHLFAGWNGFTFESPRITFEMVTNRALTAKFEPNPFAPMKGTYSGMFYNPGVSFHPSGLMTFTVTELGRVTGKLIVLGRSLPFSGSLTAYGEANIRISARAVASYFGAAQNWFAIFSIDATNHLDGRPRSDSVFASELASETHRIPNPFIWDGATFNSKLEASRVRVGTTANPSPYAGKYTLAIPGSPNPALLTASDLFSVSNFVGSLSSQTNPVSQFLWSQFSPETIAILTSSESTVSNLQATLVPALNTVLQGGSLYDPARFAMVTLSQETEELRARNPSGAELIRFNRLLLRDAYPQFITGLPTLHPEGDSYGAVTVSGSGVAKVVGSLADGAPFTASAPVATNGVWPLYASPYGVRGWLYGWTQFDRDNPANNLSGSMRWRKAPYPGKPYSKGFEVFPTLFGSTYRTATSTNRVLDFANGVVELNGPNLTHSVTNQVVLNVNNTVANQSPNRLTMTIVKSSGLFTGTVMPPGETRSLPFKGALLPTQNYGVGYYLSTNQSGKVYFGE